MHAQVFSALSHLLAAGIGTGTVVAAAAAIRLGWRRGKGASTP
jgi:Na+/alanine symporter